MSTSDGTIRFDTEINNSKLTKEISSMTKNFEAFAKTGGQSFDKVDKAAESTAETMGEVAKSIDQLQSGDMEKLQKQWDNLNAQIEVQKKLMDALQEKYERVSNLKGPDSEEALKLQKNLLKAEEALDKMIDKSDKYAEKAQKMDEASAQAASSLGKTGSQASSSAGGIEQLGSAAASADGSLDSLASSATETGQALGDISGNASSAASGLSDVASSTEGLSGSGQTAGNAMNLLSQGLQLLPGAGGSAASVITSLAGSLGGASASGAAMAGVIGGVAVGAVVALTAAVNTLFEHTEEMREGFAILEVNAEAAGVSMETVRTGMEEFNVVSEDFNANTEAMSNLLAAGFTDNNMADIVERLSDAVIKFPDTLKVESLADSLQETIATKEAVGQFGELLGRVGIDVEKFNDGLKRAAESGKEQEYVLKQLYQTDLPGTTSAYKENNKAMVEARQSSYELDQALADLAEEVSPVWNEFKKFGNWIATNFIKFLTDAIKNLKETVSLMKEVKGLGVFGSLVTAIATPNTYSTYVGAKQIQTPEVMTFARGEQVFAAPLAEQTLRSVGAGSSGLGGTGTSGDLSQLVDSLKKTLQEKTATVTNSISVYVSVDNLDGFLDILDGLKDYPLSVQKGWAGF